MKRVKFNPKKEMIFKSKFKKDYFQVHKMAKKDFYFLVGDIEAHVNDAGEFVFELGIFFDGVEYYISYDLMEYYEGIKAYFNDNEVKAKQRKIYFHNLDFDIMFFFKEVSFESELNIINSGNMILQLQDKEVIFCNSLSLLPMSLKNVVRKWLGIDFAEWENEKSNVLGLELEVLENYCKRDNFLLYFGLFKLFNKIENDYGVKSFLTIPSLAIKVFKKAYDESAVLENKKLSFFNEGYYFGGHTEKFVSGVYRFNDLEYYDVNSLYPFIMRDLKVNDSEFVMIPPSLKNVYRLLYKGGNFWVHCRITIKHDNFRCIPVKFDGANYYPIGTFDCKISNITLKFLHENNHLFFNEIYGIVTHEGENEVKFFDKYVNEFYSLRKSDKANDVVYKLLLNSLYGKFGQNETQTSMVLNPISTEDFTSVTQHGENLLCSVESKSKYKVDYFRKDIAGMITEKARVYMCENRLKCFKNGVKVIYQDTDSMIVDKNFDTLYNMKEIVCNKTLGLFKRENEKTLKECYIIGLKIYNLDGVLQANKGLKNIKQGNYKSLAIALEMENNVKKKYIHFRECKPDIKLTEFSNRTFYNTRFTKVKTYFKTGFFGIQSVPHHITKVSEKLDQLPINYYLN